MAMGAMPRAAVLLALGAVLAGCVFPPSGWSSRVAVERLAHEQAPVGSPRQAAEAFFRKAGVKWHETPNADRPRAKKAVIGWAEIRRSVPVTTSVGVIFDLGADDRIASIKVVESHTGP